MFPLSDIVEKIKDRAAGLLAFAGHFADTVKDLAAKAGEAVRGWGEKIWDLIPEAAHEKLSWFEKRPHFLLLGPVFALVFLTVLIGTLAAPGPGSGGIPAGNLGELGFFRDAAIPPEELFLPDEPDFLPGVIPEREQRKVWSVEDAEPYWYKPLSGGEEVWRERIKTVIDELLEYVP
jgi:hypothetical protein